MVQKLLSSNMALVMLA